MALFGNSSKPDGLSGKDKLLVLGSMLKDMANPAANNLDDVQTLLAKRKQAAKEQAALAEITGLLGPQYEVGPSPTVSARGGGVPGLFGSPGVAPAPPTGDETQSWTYQPPQRLPQRTLNDPQVQQALLRAAFAGVHGIGDATTILDKARTKVEVANGVAYDPYGTQPGQRVGVNLSNVNGFMTDTQDPNNAGKFLPKIEDGATPLYDEKGNVVAQRLLDGTVSVIAARKGAEAGAEAGARAPYQFVNIPNDPVTGAPRMGAASALAGRTFMGQSPTQATQAKAAAEAKVGLPQALATAETALNTISQLRNHPGRAMGSGFLGAVPGIPGTPQNDFVALVNQAKGQVFLEAFKSLKGGGQITEVEGRKATEAIARLDRAQTKEGFDKALDDLEQIIRSGASRAQQQAATGAQPGARPDRAAVEAELRRRGLIQ